MCIIRDSRSAIFKRCIWLILMFKNMVQQRCLIHLNSSSMNWRYVYSKDHRFGVDCQFFPFFSLPSFVFKLYPPILQINSSIFLSFLFSPCYLGYYLFYMKSFIKLEFVFQFHPHSIFFSKFVHILLIVIYLIFRIEFF